MGLIESWQQNRERIASEIGDSVEKVRERSFVVDGATKVLCYIAEFHPDNYNRTTPFLRSLIDSTCRASGEAGLPARPPSFEGGQCDALYQVYATLRRTFTNTGEFIQEREVNLSAHPGPIDDVFIEYQPIERGFTGVFAIILASPPEGPYRDDRRQGGNNISEELLSVRIERIDGQPDDCGNHGPTDRPPSAPIPEEETQFDVPLDGGDMTFVLNQNTFEGTRIEFNNADFDIVVDLDGFKTETDAEKPVTQPDDSVTEEEEEEEETKFAPEKLVEVVVAEEEEEVEEEGVTFDFLAVTVTTFPDAGRTYVSANPSDIHFNAAYLRWMGSGDGKGFSYPDIPIRRVQTVHPRPDNVDGYRIYAVNGAKISVITYTENQGEEE